MRCWDVFWHYPKRKGTPVRFLDVHAGSRAHAKRFQCAEVLAERGAPLRVTAKLHPYYHSMMERVVAWDEPELMDAI